MTYFSGQNWNIESLENFITQYCNDEAHILYNSHNIAVVNIISFDACQKLLGKGQIKNLCYATDKLFWDFYFNRKEERECKCLAFFNFNSTTKISYVARMAKTSSLKKLKVVIFNQYHQQFNTLSVLNAAFELSNYQLKKLYKRALTAKHFNTKPTLEEARKLHLQLFK